MAKLAIGEKWLHFPARRRDIIRPQHIPRRQHRNNPRHGPRRRDIQSTKPAMRDGGEQQRAMQQAGHFRHIIGERCAARHMTKRGIMGQRCTLAERRIHGEMNRGACSVGSAMISAAASGLASRQ